MENDPGRVKDGAGHGSCLWDVLSTGMCVGGDRADVNGTKPPGPASSALPTMLYWLGDIHSVFLDWCPPGCNNRVSPCHA
ncbi:hypothetical protein Tco_0711869 [Tanacetum coccineum]